MPFREVLDPQQLALLTRVLDDYCREAGIVDAVGRDEAAFQIMRLYRGGADETLIMSMLPIVRRRAG